jgi:hypothetical protein
MADASILIVLLVSTVVGAIAGLSLGDALSGPWLAITSGFLGVIAAAVARNYVMTRLAKAGPDDSGIPMMIVVFAAVASLAGSMAAFELTREIGSLRSGIVGALAGIISGALMSMLMAAYHMRAGQPSH